ncbi:MAG: hypothetical protein NTZ57_07775 [Deltaproteobacteria bacterium]|nr:hypothetical protein [Deltaproteobacteria bacterium]
MSKKKHLLVVLSVLIALTLVFAVNAFAQKKFFVISTGGTGGTYGKLQPDQGSPGGIGFRPKQRGL